MADLFDSVEHHYAENDGVKLHYVASGPVDAPLVVMVHGFPDFWYTWRSQIEAIHDSFRVVAVDLRGYNRSDKPVGAENYSLSILTNDVVAIIESTGRQRATVVGHDWGGAIAWSVAMNAPDSVENLIILNLPHPRGLARELAENEAQQRASGYAFNFQREGSHQGLTAEMLVGFSRGTADDQTRARFLEAFQNSDIEAMLNYYKANFPKPGGAFLPEYSQVNVPVLMFHGLDDTALLPGALADTWSWIDDVLTLVTIPNAGHWVQKDAAATVNAVMRDWLDRQYLTD